MSRRPLLSALALLLPLAAACSDDAAPNAVAGRGATATFALEATVPGDVRILTDRLGVRHVYGSSYEAVMFGQGYITAYDRFFQMDLGRRLATGRLSEIAGDLAFEADLAQRIAFMTRDGEFLEAAMAAKTAAEAPEVYELLEAYAAGVNAYIADVQAEERNGARMPVEYEHILLQVEPEDLAAWRPADTLALARLQAWSLSSSLDEEVERAETRARVPEAFFRDVFRFQPPSGATTLRATGSAAPTARAAKPAGAPRYEPQTPAALLRQLGAAARRRAAALPWLPTGNPELGSNNWIVAPSLSASGHALLANDPHLSTTNPPIWHLIHLSANLNDAARPTPEVQGVAFPGIPGAILGYNDFVAWGGTVAGYDVVDVYEETVRTPADYPASPRTVLHKGQQVPVIRKELVFHTKVGDRTAVVEIVPHHGPMVPDPDLDDDVEGLAASGQSFRWTGHEVTLDAVFIDRMLKARSVGDAKAALDWFTTGAQNWVLADVDGNIAYYPHAYVPKRPSGFDYSMPVTGTGEADWIGGADDPQWFPMSELPHADNPAEGWLATANTDLRGELQDNDPFSDATGYLYWDRAHGFRLERIQDRLGDLAERGGLTLADMQDVQVDFYSKEAERVLPYLLAAWDATAASLSAAEAEAVARLRAWLDAGEAQLQTMAGLDAGEVRSDVTTTVEVPAAARDAAVATSLFYAILNRVMIGTFADELDAYEIDWPWGDDTRALLHLLDHVDADAAAVRVWTAPAPGSDSSIWDDLGTDAVETRADVFVAALRDGVAELADWFGSDDQDRWLWGELHVFEGIHFLSLGDVSDDYNLGLDPGFPLSGGRFTVSPAHVGFGEPLEPGEPWRPSSGPSKRFVIEMDPAGPVAYNAIPGGESGHGGAEASDFDAIQPEAHYGDWLPDWLRGDSFRYRFGTDEVAADAVDVWVLK